MPARPQYVQNRRPGDDHIFDELSRHDYEALHVLKPGEVVVDVGAHAGFFASYAAEKVGAEGYVLAFEPEDDNYTLLSSCINTHSNLATYKLAVWHEHAQLPLSLSNSCAEHSLVYKRTAEVQMVEAVPLDGFLDIDHVDFLKIDVEGAELSVLVGAESIIGESRPHIAMELALEEVPAVRAWLQERQYRVELRQGPAVFLYGVP